MTDLLERVRTELDQRLTALRPSVDEYERLLQAAEALSGVAPRGGSASAAAPPTSGTPAPSPRSAKRRPATKRARPGQTQMRVIEMLRAQPGSTSAAVAQAIGISTNASAATISRLLKQGRVQRRSEGGYLAADPVAPAETAPAGAVAPDPAAAPAPIADGDATAAPAPAADGDPAAG